MPVLVSRMPAIRWYSANKSSACRWKLAADGAVEDPRPPDAVLEPRSLGGGGEESRSPDAGEYPRSLDGGEESRSPEEREDLRPSVPDEGSRSSGAVEEESRTDPAEIRSGTFKSPDAV